MTKDESLFIALKVSAPHLLHLLKGCGKGIVGKYGIGKALPHEPQALLIGSVPGHHILKTTLLKKVHHMGPKKGHYSPKGIHKGEDKYPHKLCHKGKGTHLSLFLIGKTP